MDILAAVKANDDVTAEEPVQPNRGNKTSKKNKKKNKNQDWEDESEGTIFYVIMFGTLQNGIFLGYLDYPNISKTTSCNLILYLIF